MDDSVNEAKTTDAERHRGSWRCKMPSRSLDMPDSPEAGAQLERKVHNAETDTAAHEGAKPQVQVPLQRNAAIDDFVIVAKRNVPLPRRINAATYVSHP